jgi:hypothetical protein
VCSQDRHDRDLPETVTAHNIDRLRDMVFNGPNNYPGARNVAKNGISSIYAARRSVSAWRSPRATSSIATS